MRNESDSKRFTNFWLAFAAMVGIFLATIGVYVLLLGIWFKFFD